MLYYIILYYIISYYIILYIYIQKPSKTDHKHPSDAVPSALPGEALPGPGGVFGALMAEIS